MTAMPRELLPTLEHRLLDIPDEKFVEVVRLLERVRDHPDVRQTFAIIRPRLAVVRPERRPSLRRLMCMPFEDVLESFGGADLPLGRIERRVIEPVWGIIEEFADRHQFDQLDRLVQELRPGDRNGLLNVGRRLWPLAAQVLRNAMAGDASRQLLWRRLHGDEDLRRQVEDVADFLDIGLTLEALKDDLSPKPLPELEGAHVAALEQAAQAAARQAPRLVYYLLLVAASRLATPADLLAVLHDLDLGKARREQPVLFAQLSGLVVSNLEERTARLDARDGVASPAAASAEAVVAIAERLIASVNTTTTVMDRLNEPVYRGRLEAVRIAVGEMVDNSVLKTAPGTILSAVPVPIPGRPPTVDEDAQIAAEDHARALRRCVGLADVLGLQPSVDDTLKAMGSGLTARAQALLDGYPRTAGDPDDAERAELNLFYALRLLELVAGPAKAEPLRIAILTATGERPDD